MLTTSNPVHHRSRIVARRLPALHEAVFRALNVLLPEQLSHSDCLVSEVEGAPRLYLQVLDRHPYTTFVRLTYFLGEECSHDPNAYLRIYHDARMAEATAFSPGQGIERLAGPEVSATSLLERSWRLNRALLKWLDYLLSQGHGVEGKWQETNC